MKALTCDSFFQKLLTGTFQRSILNVGVCHNFNQKRQLKKHLINPDCYSVYWFVFLDYAFGVRAYVYCVI